MFDPSHKAIDQRASNTHHVNRMGHQRYGEVAGNARIIAGGNIDITTDDESSVAQGAERPQKPQFVCADEARRRIAR